MATKEKTRPKKPPASTFFGARTRKLNKKQARDKAKKQAQKRAPLPGSFKLTAEVFVTLKKFWKPLGGIFLVYAILNVILASGVIGSISSTVGNVRSDLHPAAGQHINKVSHAIDGFGSLITGANSSGVSTTMQIVLLVLESLVIIWALRQLLAGEKITVKQAFYSATTPLVPFLLVALVIIVEFLPLTAGTAFFALVLSSAITSAAAVNVIFALLFIVLAGWTHYMISSSVFGLYIVTLPNMPPRQALRSAKNLARFRRWQLARKILFLPFFILLIMGIIIVPLILVADFLVTTVFFILLMLAILYAHTYLYSLYRRLIV